MAGLPIYVRTRARKNWGPYWLLMRIQPSETLQNTGKKTISSAVLPSKVRYPNQYSMVVRVGLIFSLYSTTQKCLLSAE